MPFVRTGSVAGKMEDVMEGVIHGDDSSNADCDRLRRYGDPKVDLLADLLNMRAGENDIP